MDHIDCSIYVGSVGHSEGLTMGRVEVVWLILNDSIGIVEFFSGPRCVYCIGDQKEGKCGVKTWISPLAEIVHAGSTQINFRNMILEKVKEGVLGTKRDRAIKEILIQAKVQSMISGAHSSL